MKDKQSSLIQSVDRALEILSCFSGDTAELGITEIAERMNLSKSTIYGLVNTLTAHRYLEQKPQTKRYQLGIALFELGNLVQRRMDLRNEAKPFCKQLAEKYHNVVVVHLAAYYDGEIIYIDKVDSQDFLIAYSYVGKRAKMYCTAVGKAVLAFLPRVEAEQAISREPMLPITEKTITSLDILLAELDMIRACGYAIDNEEIEPGLTCIAAPILNHEGRPIAAVSCSGPTSRIRTDLMDQLKNDVTNVAKLISDRMGFSG